MLSDLSKNKVCKSHLSRCLCCLAQCSSGVLMRCARQVMCFPHPRYLSTSFLTHGITPLTSQPAPVTLLQTFVSRVCHAAQLPVIPRHVNPSPPHPLPPVILYLLFVMPRCLSSSPFPPLTLCLTSPSPCPSHHQHPALGIHTIQGCEECRTDQIAYEYCCVLYHHVENVASRCKTV